MKKISLRKMTSKIKKRTTPASNHSETTRRKVLVADDDRALLELTSDFLRSAGFQVHSVTDPRLVLQEVLAWHPHLVILDLEMPGLDGLEVLQLIRTHPQTRSIPVIVVSVVAEDAWRSKLLETAQAVFSKPLSYADLLDSVKKMAVKKGEVAEGHEKSPVGVRDFFNLDPMWAESHALSNA